MSPINELEKAKVGARGTWLVPLSTAIAIVERLERQCKSGHVPIATTAAIIDELNESKQQVATLTAENGQLKRGCEHLQGRVSTYVADAVADEDRIEALTAALEKARALIGFCELHFNLDDEANEYKNIALDEYKRALAALGEPREGYEQ